MVNLYEYLVICVFTTTTRKTCLLLPRPTGSMWRSKDLLQQQIQLKNVMSDSFIYPNLNSKEEDQIIDQDDYFLREDSLRSGTVFFGPLSWVSLVTTEKSSMSNDELLYSLREAEKFNYDQTKVKVVKKATTQANFSDLSKSIVNIL